MVASRENFPLIAELLADQQTLQTPVAQFADAHAAGSAQIAALSHRLLPLSKPKPGEQYAFEVDLDSCTGCKSCVAACHSLNGLDEHETWRDVGLLVSPTRRKPFTQTGTTACHHCADPACLNGCPVLAYDKDPVTGIVRHLDDQCIGCSYCILKCPYDVPKFSERLGIVRKCDMCHGRLAEGEAPACAQACPTHAIRIVTVSTASTPAFLPAAPDPAYTRPTTRYVSKRTLPDNLAAGDATALVPQPPHWPLVVLLMLMPMAVGCGVADKLLDLPSPGLAVTCWVAGAGGLAFSVLHLGRPLRAWRVFLGLRKSWLSREALAFGAWLPLATAYTAVRLGWLGVDPRLQSAMAVATALLGALGLFCSVMVYVDTRRDFWRFAHTGPRFFGTAVVLGLASAFAVAPDYPAPLGFLLAGAVFAKLIFEARALAPLRGDRDAATPALKTAKLLFGPLRKANEMRVLAAILGGGVIPLAVALDVAPGGMAWLALGVAALGELAERYLFFRAVDAPKMPGLPSA